MTMTSCACIAKALQYRWQQIRFFTPTKNMPTIMEPSKVKYAYIEEGVERLDYYVRGGYHPVKIGDEFQEGRYVIAHKLGFGRSATIWLAEDKVMKKFVALKISTAESVEQTHEEQILLQLAKSQSVLPGKAMIQTLLNSFTFSGWNGMHRCLVTDAARVSIHVAKDMAYHRLLQLEVARAIASQLILALQFVHAQGVVHGESKPDDTDLHTGNILLHLSPNIQRMTCEQLYINVGRPDEEPVVRADSLPLDNGVPLKIVFPVLLGLRSDEIKLADSSILLTDFGEAFDPQRTERFTAHAPVPLSPPESRFADEPLSFPSDIWTLGCVIWDLFGSSPPFEAFPGSQDDITIEHVETFGKLPDQWWSKWETRGNWFDEDGHKNVKESLQQYYGNTSRSWTQRFAEINISRKSKKLKIFDPEEKKSFHDMMQSMLVLEPSERASIDDVVRCEWMQRWGLPEFQRMQNALRD
ncbi:protein kinase [Histoplasma capsulatum H143]|uniref:non-specific serine/threonine protein kinase n=1 Tax=Ajellomyces capsulatus (strain H143) TaxID=544712 RepID=C6HRV0_AJECH|nr:protein kinase [Histoplasma capsulatum H143]